MNGQERESGDSIMPKANASSRSSKKIGNTEGKRLRNAKRRTGFTKSEILGNKNKSKKNRLRCKQCGRYFSSLKHLSTHYKVANHPREKKPPKKLSLDANFPPEKIETAKAILNLLENPYMIRELVQEHLKKKGLKYALRS